MSSVATCTDGKSGGKLWLLAIASNASKQMRPHSGMSAAVMGRISRFTSFLPSRSDDDKSDAQPCRARPVEFVLWLSIPHHKLDQYGGEIGTRPETRIRLSTVGSMNLKVMSQVHQISDLFRNYRTGAQHIARSRNHRPAYGSCI